MEGDGFSDPRHRAARRPRGGARGRGRGRERGRRRGRGQPNVRASQKRPTNVKPRAIPNLGSNEYRFRENEEDEEEQNVYDLGADFEEVASQPMYDPTASNEDAKEDVNLSEELVADFSKLESVLASVPLWVRLGEHSRFALGVPESDKIDNYLDPLPSESVYREDIKTSPTNNPDTGFRQEVADLSLDDDVAIQDDPSQMKGKRSIDQHETRHIDDFAASTAQTKQTPASSSQSEERDDFDKWLDEI